jgi:hypothetical protein
MRECAQKQQELHRRQGMVLLYFFVTLLICGFLWGQTSYEDAQDPFLPQPLYDTSSAFEKASPVASKELEGSGTVRL